jgi:hypothetical protein
MYLPKRYFSGLSKTKKQVRSKELTKRAKLSWKDPKAYRPFKTDIGVKTRKSKWSVGNHDAGSFTPIFHLHA